MLLYVRAHYTQRICVRRIADSACISEWECIRCFRKIIRITPLQYVIEMRLSKARHLLPDTDLPVIDICAACGFESQSYFTKIFRERTGVSPLKFRKERL